MRPLLLDTHAWVWYLASPENLPPDLLARLDAARQREALFISAITPWEVAVLARKGRLAFSLDTRHWLEEALRVPGITVVPLDGRTALEAAHLDLPHPDPADRFIAATALRLGAILVTKDTRLQGFQTLETLWE